MRRMVNPFVYPTKTAATAQSDNESIRGLCEEHVEESRWWEYARQQARVRQDGRRASAQAGKRARARDRPYSCSPMMSCAYNTQCVAATPMLEFHHLVPGKTQNRKRDATKTFSEQADGGVDVSWHARY